METKIIKNHDDDDQLTNIDRFKVQTVYPM